MITQLNLIESNIPIYDVKGDEITDPDLTIGFLSSNYEYDEEGELVLTSYTYRQDRIAMINDLKNKLKQTDYVVIKMSEYQFSSESINEDDKARYEQIMVDRQTWRDKINYLESLS